MQAPSRKSSARTRLVGIALALLAGFALACSGAPSSPTPVVGNLPDPVRLMPADALAQLFGAAPAAPTCRFASTHYRCTWTDPASAERRLRITTWSDATAARAAIGSAAAQPVTVAGADEAAAIVDEDAAEVWAVVRERGLQLTWSPGAGADPAAHLAAAIAATSAIAPLLAP